MNCIAVWRIKVNNYSNIIKKLTSEEKASSMITNAFKELIPQKKNDYIIGLVILSFSIIIAALVSFSQDTQYISQNIVKELLSVELALFGCIFTVYSISLAFFSDNYLKRLSHIMDKSKADLLTSSIKYYESVLFIFFLGICLSIAVIILLISLPENMRVFYNIMDEITAFTCLLMYLSLTLRIIYEIKSTIYNTISLFRVHIAYKFIDFNNEEMVDNINNQEQNLG